MQVSQLELQSRMLWMNTPPEPVFVLHKEQLNQTMSDFSEAMGTLPFYFSYYGSELSWTLAIQLEGSCCHCIQEVLAMYILSLTSLTHFCKRREGSGELPCPTRMQLAGWRNHIALLNYLLWSKRTSKKHSQSVFTAFAVVEKCPNCLSPFAIFKTATATQTVM